MLNSGGCLGPRDPEHGRLGSARLGLARLGEPLGKGREVDVLGDLDALARRRAGRHFLDDDHQVLDRANHVALVDSRRPGCPAASRRGRSPGSRARASASAAGAGKSAPGWPGASSPVEAAADQNALRPRPEREIRDQEVIRPPGCHRRANPRCADRRSAGPSRRRSAPELPRALPGESPGETGRSSLRKPSG